MASCDMEMDGQLLILKSNLPETNGVIMIVVKLHVTSLTSTWILPSLLLAHVMVEQYHVYVGKYLPKYKRGRISNQKNARVKKIKHNYTNTAHMTHFGRKDSADTDVVFTNRADQHTQEKP